MISKFLYPSTSLHAKANNKFEPKLMVKSTSTTIRFDKTKHNFFVALSFVKTWYLRIIHTIWKRGTYVRYGNNIFLASWFSNIYWIHQNLRKQHLLLVFWWRSIFALLKKSKYDTSWVWSKLSLTSMAPYP